MNDILPMASPGLNEIIISRIVAEANSKKLSRVTVLDLGAGEGYNAAGISKALTNAGVKFSITCTDISDMRFKLKDVPGILFEMRDLNSDFIFGKFDFVIGTEILEHMENPYHFLQMCLQNLSPEGSCYLTTPNVEHIFSLIKQFFLGRPMWFSVNEPSGHIMPIHNFMMEEALRRISEENRIAYHLERTFNRNCLPFRIAKGHLPLSTIPGNNRILGEINIFRIFR